MEKSKFKILIIFGTRPEVIKLAPFIKELNKHSDHIDLRVCVTGQHRQMLDPLLKLFSIEPDDDLDLMQENQTLEGLTSLVITKSADILKRECPDYVVVQGDTTTSMAVSLAAYYQKIKVVHIEAGLRTGDKYAPFPEEINRKIIDNISDLYFVHTEMAKQNLIREGILEEKIEVTGNTVIDTLLDVVNREYDIRDTALENIPFDTKKIILVTAHRRESFGPSFENMCNAIKEAALEFSSVVDFVFPVHLNPHVHEPVYSILKSIDNIHLIEPLDYPAFVYCMKNCHFILSDSGGIQEEAPSLNKPVLVMRDTTERQEALEAGATCLVGTEKKSILNGISRLLKDPIAYKAMSEVVNPYGDGKASERIVRRLIKSFQ
ncbi:UDP-N-acetylglucosamine 2-epimerase [hydrothermal vent metagenome]|uniref:UDP-N-acetylglucosamine 2-epimerase (non-hydrolyzing) n=1 Tax=hydrothermal vent metagenome TaxID=652676 RepID=A0A3B0VXG9_9ZZZZ